MNHYASRGMVGWIPGQQSGSPSTARCVALSEQCLAHTQQYRDYFPVGTPAQSMPEQTKKSDVSSMIDIITTCTSSELHAHVSRIKVGRGMPRTVVINYMQQSYRGRNLCSDDVK